MEKKKVVHGLGVLVAVLIAISLFLAASSESAAQPKPPMAPVTLLYNGGIYKPDDDYGKTIRWFCEEVTKRTNGLVKFKNVWSFALTKPGEEIDAIKTGLSQLGAITDVYYPARLFLHTFENCIFGGDADYKRAITWIEKLYHTEAGRVLHQELEREGVKFLYVDMDTTPRLESRMPIKRLDDLKGKKIAISGVWAEAHVVATGAVALSPTMVDRGTMLQTGALDGSILPEGVSFSFKLYEFAKYNIPLEWTVWMVNHGAINLKLFESFPKEIQKVFIDVGREATRHAWEVESASMVVRRKTMEAAGVNFNPPLPEEDRLRWIAQGGEPIAKWLKEADKRGLGAQGNELIKNFFHLVEETGYKWPEALKKQLK